MLFFFLSDTSCSYFFFFQAEDGIRDGHVTGVQTCALPIWRRLVADPRRERLHRRRRDGGRPAVREGRPRAAPEPAARARAVKRARLVAACALAGAIVAACGDD